ncbi:hypothetical protein [Peribacillus sp. S4]
MKKWSDYLKNIKEIFDKYLFGSVMIISGILLQVITHGKPFKVVG